MQYGINHVGTYMTCSINQGPSQYDLFSYRTCVLRAEAQAAGWTDVLLGRASLSRIDSRLQGRGGTVGVSALLGVPRCTPR
jgi:hypothetical protein